LLELFGENVVKNISIVLSHSKFEKLDNIKNFLFKDGSLGPYKNQLKEED